MALRVSSASMFLSCCIEALTASLVFQSCFFCTSFTLTSSLCGGKGRSKGQEKDFSAHASAKALGGRQLERLPHHRHHGSGLIAAAPHPSVGLDGEGAPANPISHTNGLLLQGQPFPGTCHLLPHPKPISADPHQEGKEETIVFQLLLKSTPWQIPL